jgi:hypothetical protein
MYKPALEPRRGPFVAQSGHATRTVQCPLCGVKQTSGADVPERQLMTRNGLGRVRTHGPIALQRQRQGPQLRATVDALSPLVGDRAKANIGFGGQSCKDRY